MKVNSTKNLLKSFFIFGMIFLIGVFLISFASATLSSSPQYTIPGSSSVFLSGQGAEINPRFQPGFTQEMCEAGQDFLIQIPPFGCEPAIVRSDLLEEQNVPVFCQLSATKINPLIDVEAINYISFKGAPPEGVSGIAFHPARSAVKPSSRTLINSPTLNNIGYAVVVLEQIPNESAMPDWVEGEMTAYIKYDIENAFGIGQANYYLPLLTNDEWARSYKQYGFWNGKGYLRVEDVDENNARIGIYADETQKISTVTLKRGETSRAISLLGFYCLAGLKLRLDGLTDPDERARFNIDGNVVEIADGEKFLNNACVVLGLNKYGLVESVDVSCRTDDKTESFTLAISPKITLSIDGNPGNYVVGDELFSVDKNMKVYLGYIGTDKNEIPFIIPVSSDAKTSEEFKESFAFEQFAREVDAYKYRSGNVPFDFIKDKLVEKSKALIHFGTYAGGGETSGKWIYIENKESYVSNKASGKGTIDYLKMSFEFSKTVLFGPLAIIMKAKDFIGGESLSAEAFYDKYVLYKGRTIKFLSFTTPGNLEFSSSQFKENFDNAIKDYNTVARDFPNEGDELNNYAEQALVKAIRLSASTEQKTTLVELCSEFREKFPNSEERLTECDDKERLSSSEISSQNVLIGGESKLISFEGIYEPSADEYSASIYISGKDDKDGELGSKVLMKDTPVTLLDLDTITLQRLDEENIEVKFNVDATTKENWLEATGTTYTIKKNQDFGPIGERGYMLRIEEIKLQQQVKISVIPEIQNAGTEANFSFKIGIEKRAIQLSPEKTKQRIKDLEGMIESWKKINENLGNVVSVMKGGCFAVSGLLTVKNFLGNLGGKPFARQEVMQGTNGWIDRCTKEVQEKKFVSVDACLLHYNDDIEKDVNLVNSFTQAQNDNPITEETIKDSQRAEEVKAKLEKCDASLLTPDLESALSSSGLEKGAITLTKLRDLERFVDMACSDGLSESVQKAAKSRMEGAVKNIKKEAKDLDVQSSFLEEAKKNNLDGIDVSWDVDNEAIKGTYNGWVLTGDKINCGGCSYFSSDKKYNLKVQGYGTEKYLFVLDSGEGVTYGVTKVFKFDSFQEGGIKISEFKDQSISRKFSYTKYDSNSYKTKIDAIDKKVKYFETEPYRGFPAQVPFDTSEGWYAKMQQTVPAFGGIRAYDDSGRLVSFEICNVMEDGRISSGDYGDDVCMKFNPGTGKIAAPFPDLDEAKTGKLVNKAVSAVQDAEKAYNKDVYGKQISILGEKIVVDKTPAANVPEFQCQNFMSPKDCNLMFNVCDPVICPSSRCNLGGNYYVSNVVQSGIIGSIALCLPNIREKIIVPVCLTGIHAGIDGVISIMESSKQCLEENLESGEMTGICDEMTSIYMCEMFWRQAQPFAKWGIPKLLEVITGQGARGGGEYMDVQSAWENAENGITYMTQYYGADAFKAFKLRASDKIGSAACQSFISARYPSSIDFFDSLLEPDSPTQFHAWFEENVMTTATVPPTSHYKVFYHLFAGKDAGVYYTVYLRSPESGGIYNDNPTVPVPDSTGYIPVGDFVSETKDFTAPSGYKELCIKVNEQLECGFKGVDTSFAVNYASDMYLAEQSKQQVTKTSECESGTSSAWSLLNPNVQEGVDEVINPELSNYGIIRVCSTDDPGKATDGNYQGEDARWRDVGYCDSEEMRCWLDTNSVKDQINAKDLEEGVLEETTANFLARLEASGEVITKGSFDELKSKIDGLDSPGIISLLTNELIGKIFLTKDKAWAFSARGDAYGKLAQLYFNELKAEAPAGGDVVSMNIDETKGGILDKALSLVKGDTRKKILKAVEELDGTDSRRATIGGPVQDYDCDKKTGAGCGICCWDAVIHVYNEAGVKNSGWVYSIKQGESFELKDSTGKEYTWEVPFSTKENIGDKIRQVNLLPGDILSIAYNQRSLNDVGNFGPHNVIFIGWVDEPNRIAKLFDWNAPGKEFGYFDYDLSDDRHLVYNVAEPIGGSSSGDSSSSSESSGSCGVVVDNEKMFLKTGPCISEESIKKILQEAGSPVADNAGAFYDLGKKYGIDPTIALAFFKVESNFGKSIGCNDPSISKNPGNIKIDSAKLRCTETYFNSGSECTSDTIEDLEKRGFCKFNSWEEGIEAWYKTMTMSPYISDGKEDVDSLFPTYSPASGYSKKVRDLVNDWRREYGVKLDDGFKECGDCGWLNCDKEVCSSIGKQIGKNCVYDIKWINECVESATNKEQETELMNWINSKDSKITLANYDKDEISAMWSAVQNKDCDRCGEGGLNICDEYECALITSVFDHLGIGECKPDKRWHPMKCLNLKRASGSPSANPADSGSLDLNKCKKIPQVTSNTIRANVGSWYGSTQSEIQGKLETINFFGVNLQIHEKVAPALECAIAEIKNSCENYNVIEKDTMSFEWRKSVGKCGESSSLMSFHSYGISFDINQDDNPYCVLCNEEVTSCYGQEGCSKDPGASADWEQRCKAQSVNGQVPRIKDIPDCWINVFKKYGFDWGGDWGSLKDPQHFEWHGNPLAEVNQWMYE